jgi:uncharacterized protein YbjT (DUF2867 family)
MILITGANGTFGGHVAKAVLERGVSSLRLASSSLEKLKSNFGDKAELVSFDWNKPESFASILAGVESVYLIAPPFSTTFDETTGHFIEAAKTANVKHIVLTTAYGMDAAEGTSGYKSEQLLINSGVSYTILRPNFIFQNFVNYDLDFIKNGITFFPSGTGSTSYIDIQDIASVSAEVLINPDQYTDQALTLTGSEALTHDQMAAMLSTALGREIKNMNPSEEEYKSTLKSHGVPAQVYDFMAVLYGAIKAGHMVQATNVVKQLTGKEPISFKSFIESNRTVFQLSEDTVTSK